MKQAIQVERVHQPSPEVFKRDYLSRGRPVVLTGVMDSWPALSRWSLDYFRARVGSRRVPVEVRLNGNMNHGERFEEMSISEYLDHVEKGEREYFLTDQPTAQVLPELHEDTPILPYARGYNANACLFIGRNTYAAMHYHLENQAILCQPTGQKRVVLYSPDDFSRLYPQPWFLPRSNYSRMDFSQPELIDTRTFPALAQAQPYECTLAAGEALFIPLHWWHTTYGHELSISVTFFWRARRSEWPLSSLGLRAFAGSRLERHFYEPASQVKGLERLYHSLRRRLNSRAEASAPARSSPSA